MTNSKTPIDLTVEEALKVERYRIYKEIYAYSRIPADDGNERERMVYIDSVYEVMYDGLDDELIEMEAKHGEIG